MEKAKIRVFYVAIDNRRYGIKGKSALQTTIYRTAVFLQPLLHIHILFSVL
ncbi:MAG: hypothetical protein J6B88_01650 [Clostridia bacterium]|nr:hypothetical protein [Clostridia bacterium]